MSSLSFATVLFAFAALVVGAALAWFPTFAYFRSQIRHLNDRMDYNEKSKVKANEMLLHARKQVETLQQDLSDAKRNGAIETAAASARASVAAARAERMAEMARQLDNAPTTAKAAAEFADTMPMIT